MTAPLPPDDFDGRALTRAAITAGTSFHRFYSASYDPIFFDRSDRGRFNSPDQSYGVLYVAKETAGAFAETFLRTPGHTLLDSELVASKAYVRLGASRPLILALIAGPALARIGATAEVPHGGLPYFVPQAWSRAFFLHPAGVDGIAYHARHDDTELCYALFDRARAAIFEVERETNLDQDWFWELALRYGVGLAP